MCCLPLSHSHSHTHTFFFISLLSTERRRRRGRRRCIEGKMAVLDRYTRNCCCSWEAAEKERSWRREWVGGKDTGWKQNTKGKGKGENFYVIQVEMTSCCSWSAVPFGVVGVVWLRLLLLLELNPPLVTTTNPESFIIWL